MSETQVSRSEELKVKILRHYADNPGVDIHYKTLGSDYHECHPIYEALFAEGKLERRKVPSKSGKTIQTKIFATGA